MNDRMTTKVLKTRPRVGAASPIITTDFTVHVHLSHEQSRCHKGVNQLMLHALHCNTLSCFVAYILTHVLVIIINQSSIILCICYYNYHYRRVFVYYYYTVSSNLYYYINKLLLLDNTITPCLILLCRYNLNILEEWVRENGLIDDA